MQRKREPSSQRAFLQVPTLPFTVCCQARDSTSLGQVGTVLNALNASQPLEVGINGLILWVRKLSQKEAKHSSSRHPIRKRQTWNFNPGPPAIVPVL